MKKVIIFLSILSLSCTLFSNEVNNKKTIGIVKSKDGMNLRESAGTGSRQIGYMPYLSQLAILDMNGPEEVLYGISSRWYKIEYAEIKGWVFGGFIEIVVNDAKNEKVIGIVESKDGMNLREGASKTTKLIDFMPYLSQVIILEMNGPEETLHNVKSRWFKIKYMNKEGWVFGGFVRVINTNEVENAADIKAVSSAKVQIKKTEIKNTAVSDKPDIETPRVVEVDLNISKVEKCVKDLLNSYHDEKVMSIAVHPYIGKGKVKPDQMQMINNLVFQTLIKDRRFKVIEREMLSGIVKEIELQQTGLTLQAVEVGNIAGAQLLLMYRIVDGILDLRIVETSSAHVRAFSGVNLLNKI